MLERRRCKPRASSLNVNHFARSTSFSRIATRLELPREQTMATHAAAGLSELVLSSTHAASPLPTISLHNPLTGALVYSFRSPVASTSHASSSSTGLARNGIGSAADKDQPSLENRTTFAAVEGVRDVVGTSSDWAERKAGQASTFGISRGCVTLDRPATSALRFRTTHAVADLSMRRAGDGPASVDPAREAHDYDCQPRWDLHGRRNSRRSHLPLGGERPSFLLLNLARL